MANHGRIEFRSFKFDLLSLDLSKGVPMSHDESQEKSARFVCVDLKNFENIQDAINQAMLARKYKWHDAKAILAYLFWFLLNQT